MQVEQQQVLRPVIRLLKRYKLVIVGSREFHSIELAQWLHCQHLSFVLRQKRSTTFREKRQPFQSLDSIPVQPGIHLFYPRVGFTQKNGFSRFNRRCIRSTQISRQTRRRSLVSINESPR
jgi:hypothetical protein